MELLQKIYVAVSDIFCPCASMSHEISKEKKKKGEGAKRTQSLTADTTARDFGYISGINFTHDMRSLERQGLLKFRA